MPAGRFAKTASSMLFKSYIGGGGNNNPGKDPHIHIGPSQISRPPPMLRSQIPTNMKNPFIADMRNPFADSRRPAVGLKRFNWE